MAEPIPASASPSGSGPGPRRRPSPLDPILETERDEPEADEGALSAPGPMGEIAQAFRANAEAIVALRELQGEMVQALRRGDRSEIVLQNTQALNETFRNMAAIQRELLTRLDHRQGRSRAVPLLLLGLLVVVLAGVWVLLDAIERNAQRGPIVDPLAIAARERDIWKEGRSDGAAQADRELRLLQQGFEEAEARREALQRQIDLKNAELDAMARTKRDAEIERDDMAGRVRHAQQELMARQVLEDEVKSLTSRLAVTDEELRRAMQDLARRQRENAALREKAVDYGLDLAPDPDAGAVPRTAPGQDPAPFPAPVAPVGSEVPPPARTSEPPPTAGRETGPQELPPPLLKREGPLTRDQQLTGRVRERINQLLQASGTPGGETWHLTRLDAMGQDRLSDVIALRYDARGRLLDGIEARELRIHYDRENRKVEFHFMGGDRVTQSARTALPADGMRLEVASGELARAWGNSGLSMIQLR